MSSWKTNETKKQGNLNKLKLKLKQDITFTVKIAKTFKNYNKKSANNEHSVTVGPLAFLERN